MPNAMEIKERKKQFLQYQGLLLQLPALGAVICFENLSAGMGTAAFVGFMASQTDRRFTATQYALLSSLMGGPSGMWRRILPAGRKCRCEGKDCGSFQA